MRYCNAQSLDRYHSTAPDTPFHCLVVDDKAAKGEDAINRVKEDVLVVCYSFGFGR